MNSTPILEGAEFPRRNRSSFVTAFQELCQLTRSRSDALAARRANRLSPIGHRVRRRCRHKATNSFDNRTRSEDGHGFKEPIRCGAQRSNSGAAGVSVGWAFGGYSPLTMADRKFAAVVFASSSDPTCCRVCRSSEIHTRGHPSACTRNDHGWEHRVQLRSGHLQILRSPMRCRFVMSRCPSSGGDIFLRPPPVLGNLFSSLRRLLQRRPIAEHLRVIQRAVDHEPQLQADAVDRFDVRRGGMRALRHGPQRRSQRTGSNRCAGGL